MARVFFVRHAKPDATVKDDRNFFDWLFKHDMLLEDGIEEYEDGMDD